VRLLVTGGTGVLGRALRPLADAAGHELAMPGHDELHLFDPAAVAAAVRDVDGFLHLATPILRSALAAEQQTERFARAGGRGVVLRFGLLDGPGTWFDQPMGDFGATLHVSDAGRALLSALSLPSGIYNVCRDGERVSAERFTRAAGWHPQQ
jgi:nucleoside-diphosphate-sugar epimerase